jgi:RNA polymerase II subunit A C-terminal domain phosphatase SSU72
MEAHLNFYNAHLQCTSYGTGTAVKLPGRTPLEPKVFKFGTPYSEMFDSITSEGDDFFNKNGIIPLCRRGASVKDSPTRWQDTDTDTIARHDVVLAFEERIYDAVVEDLQGREPTEAFAPLVVICLDTKDNPEEASKMGRRSLELAYMLEGIQGGVEEGVDEIVEAFGEKMREVTDTKVVYQVIYL